jgi:WD40 repeat protein
VSFWNIPGEGSPISSFRPGVEDPAITCLCWSKSAQLLAVSSIGGNISILTQTGTLHDSLKPDSTIDPSHRVSSVMCATFSSNALSICTGGSDGLLRLWDCKRREIVKVTSCKNDLERFFSQMLT